MLPTYSVAHLFNHQLLPILDKVSFDLKISSFFSDYLIGKKTQYLQNNFIFPFFCVDIGVDQSSTLSLILSTLYLSSIFHIFKKSKRSYLFYSYNIIFSLFEQFGLVIEHREYEVLFFSRSYRLFNLPLLDLSLYRGPVFKPKDIQRYLRFIFDKKLSF